MRLSPILYSSILIGTIVSILIHCLPLIYNQLIYILWFFPYLTSHLCNGIIGFWSLLLVQVIMLGYIISLFVESLKKINSQKNKKGFPKQKPFKITSYLSYHPMPKYACAPFGLIPSIKTPLPSG